tara:strand:- start:979 stop:1185 length:207 start_codon:yes stop_codon:yes gene_type:complete
VLEETELVLVLVTDVSISKVLLVALITLRQFLQQEVVNIQSVLVVFIGVVLENVMVVMDVHLMLTAIT